VELDAVVSTDDCALIIEHKHVADMDALEQLTDTLDTLK